MTVQRLYTGLSMTSRMLVRRRITLLLLLVIPFAFLTVVDLTTSEKLVPFKVASLEPEVFITLQEKGISIIFFAVACAGFLVSFVALNLVQKDSGVNRRLILCGYNPVEIILSKLLSLLLVITIVALYITVVTHLYFSIQHPALFALGLVLIGLVYGSYGMAVGGFIRGELEGILLIVLLANIDAGWLQNPLFYAGAEHRQIIRFFPAYYPSQTSIIAAATNYSTKNAVLYSVIYAAALFFIAILTFYYKMRIRK